MQRPGAAATGRTRHSSSPSLPSTAVGQAAAPRLSLAAMASRLKSADQCMTAAGKRSREGSSRGCVGGVGGSRRRPHGPHCLHGGSGQQASPAHAACSLLTQAAGSGAGWRCARSLVSWRCRRESRTSGVRRRAYAAGRRCDSHSSSGAQARKVSSHSSSSERSWLLPPRRWPHNCSGRRGKWRAAWGDHGQAAPGRQGMRAGTATQVAWEQAVAQACGKRREDRANRHAVWGQAAWAGGGNGGGGGGAPSWL